VNWKQQETIFQLKLGGESVGDSKIWKNLPSFQQSA